MNVEIKYFEFLAIICFILIYTIYNIYHEYSVPKEEKEKHSIKSAERKALGILDDHLFARRLREFEKNGQGMLVENSPAFHFQWGSRAPLWISFHNHEH